MHPRCGPSRAIDYLRSSEWNVSPIAPAGRLFRAPFRGARNVSTGAAALGKTDGAIPVSRGLPAAPRGALGAGSCAGRGRARREREAHQRERPAGSGTGGIGKRRKTGGDLPRQPRPSLDPLPGGSPASGLESDSSVQDPAQLPEGPVAGGILPPLATTVGTARRRGRGACNNSRTIPPGPPRSAPGRGGGGTRTPSWAVAHAGWAQGRARASPAPTCPPLI